MRFVAAFLLLLVCASQVGGEYADNTTDGAGRSLKGFQLVRGSEGCPQGLQALNTHETMYNHHDYWEQAWGRTDASWPRRGFQSCWDNRGDTCQLPDQDNVVCLPGSRRGSTINKGWALDPKSQGCVPGVHCLYACEPGYYWTTFNDGETSNYDHVNGPKRGHCDGTWDYGTSTHGVYCQEDGTLAFPEQPLCMLGETYVFAENRLDTHVFLCQTVFPGHEIFLIPTLVKPGETVMMTTQPKHFWSGPTYANPTHGDIYVGFAGADIMESCTWDEFSPSGAALLPYEIGSGVEDNGVVYSTHYYYQQPNSEVPWNMVGYELDLTCESSEWGVCGDTFRNADVVKVDVLKKPSPGTTSVKFVFNPPTKMPRFQNMYKDPNRVFFPDPHIITSMKYYGTYDASSGDYGSEATNGGGYHTYVQQHGHGNTHGHQWVEQSGHDQGGHQGGDQGGHQGGNQGGDQGWPSGDHGGAHATVFEAGSRRPTGQSLRDSARDRLGRKLKAVNKGYLFLENKLMEPLVLCQREGKESIPGVNVGPGEKLALDGGSVYHVARKVKGKTTCSSNEHPWILSTGTVSESDPDKSFYSYKRNDKADDHGNHMDYTILLKCSSSNELCDLNGGREVSLSQPPIADPELSITYVVLPKSATQRGSALKEMVSNFARNVLGMFSMSREFSGRSTQEM